MSWSNFVSQLLKPRCCLLIILGFSSAVALCSNLLFCCMCGHLFLGMLRVALMFPSVLFAMFWMMFLKYVSLNSTPLWYVRNQASVGLSIHQTLMDDISLHFMLFMLPSWSQISAVSLYNFIMKCTSFRMYISGVSYIMKTSFPPCMPVLSVSLFLLSSIGPLGVVGIFMSSVCMFSIALFTLVMLLAFVCAASSFFSCCFCSFYWCPSWQFCFLRSFWEFRLEALTNCLREQFDWHLLWRLPVIELSHFVVKINSVRRNLTPIVTNCLWELSLGELQKLSRPVLGARLLPIPVNC